MTEKETLEIKEWINQEIENELLELRGLYEQAVKDNKESFLWGDQEMLTSFAKYYLEYYESQLKTQ
jgi:hypothetical protein